MFKSDQPLMTLRGPDGEAISDHADEIEAAEQACAIGPGVYSLERPTQTIEVFMPDWAEQPEPEPEPEPEPDPEPEPEPDPDPKPPPSTDKPEDIRMEWNRHDYYCFTNYYRGGSAYNRGEKLTIVRAGSQTLKFASLNQAKQRTMKAGTEFTLTADGKSVATMTLAQDTKEAAIDVPVSDLSNGWHTFAIEGDGVHFLPYPVFVYRDSGQSDWMPVYATRYESTRGNDDYPYFWLKWVRRAFDPTIDPLEPRTFTPFSHVPDGDEITSARLVIGHGSEVRRPLIHRSTGIMTTAGKHRYHFHDFTKKLPPWPLLDGPRGFANAQGVTHIQIGDARQDDSPDSPRVGNCYATDTWRFFRTGPDGHLKTLLGHRTKSAPGEKGPQELELVGDWSAIPAGRRGLHEPWGFAWMPASIRVDPDADRIPDEQNRRPHITGPVVFIADTQNNRIIRGEFDPRSHDVPAKVTEFITDIADPWECVEWNGKLIVSERNSNRIAQYSMETGALERVIVEGAAVGSVKPTRLVVRWHGRDPSRAREEDVTAPEGLYVVGDWLYYASQMMAQVKRVHLIDGRIEHVTNITANFSTGNKFAKITVSDGSFLPKGTVFVGQWDNGIPDAYLPDGRKVSYGWGPSVIYDICCAIKGGRFVYGGCGEGINELRLRTEPSGGKDLSEGRRKWREQGYYLTHGEDGYGFYGLPLPWGEDDDIDALLSAWNR